MTLPAHDRHRIASVYDQIVQVASSERPSHTELQQLLDEYASLRMKDSVTELTTAIHEWWLVQSERQTRNTPLGFARDLAHHVVRRGFLERNGR